MKQPMEGIQGIDMSNIALLSLEDNALTVRLMMMRLFKYLWEAVLVGNPAPNVRRMFERMRNPQIDDLVIESSAVFSEDPKGLGLLLDHRDEWWQTDEEWATSLSEDLDLKDEDRQSEHVWYIQYGCAAIDICRWTNCSFVMVPVGVREFDEASVFDRGKNQLGLSIVRESLIDFLSDVGITCQIPHG